MKINTLYLLSLLLIWGCQIKPPVASETSKWDQLTKGTEKFSGFMNYYYDSEKGKIYLENF